MITIIVLNVRVYRSVDYACLIFCNLEVDSQFLYGIELQYGFHAEFA